MPMDIACGGKIQACQKQIEKKAWQLANYCQRWCIKDWKNENQAFNVYSSKPSINGGETSAIKRTHNLH